MIQPKKSHTWYLQLEESTANTHVDVLFNLIWSHHWLKMAYFGHISCLLRWEIIFSPNFTTEDFRVQVMSSLANYVYGCHMTLVTHGALGYASYQKGIIQGHLVHRYASGRTPTPYSRTVFRAVLWLDVGTRLISCITCPQNIHRGVGYFWCFWRPCYALVVMSNRWNQDKFSTLHRLYFWGQRWILVLLLIFVDWYKHSNTNVAGSRCILNRFWCIIWRPKSIFDQNVHIT